MTVLVVVAHADDESLGMGGTIARLSAEDHVVYVAVLADGVTSRYADPVDADTDAVNVRAEQCEAACKLLGVRAVHQYGYPDQRLDCVSLVDITRNVSLLIENLKPNIVYTHHGGDLNQDHRIVHASVMIATRPTPDCSVRAVYTFEVPSSTEWVFAGEPFRPNVFVDVADYMVQKLAAINCYETEVRQYPHPRSVTAIRARAQYWGSVAGLYAAEPFVLVRSVGGWA